MPEYSILHLDDNPMFLEQMTVLMDFDSSIRYRPVQYPEDAKTELEKELPDLLIVDLMLKNDWDARDGSVFAKDANKSYPKTMQRCLNDCVSNKNATRHRLDCCSRSHHRVHGLHNAHVHPQVDQLVSAQSC